MATTSKLLQIRPTLKPNPTFSHFYSSSSSNSKDPQIPPPPQEPRNEPPPTSKPFSFSSIANNIQTPSSKSSSSFDDIRQKLAGYRLRTGDSSSPSPTPPSSFQELYKRNLNSERPRPPSFDFNALRQNLQKIGANNNNNSYQNENRGKMFDSLSLSRLKDSLKLRPNADQRSGMVIGGTEKLPASIFGKEMARNKLGNKEMNTTEFVTTYSQEVLGEKLKKLRTGKKEFSLQELNERLLKLREMEAKETESRIGGIYQPIKESLVTLSEQTTKKSIIQRLDILGQLGGTPSFMLHPPKEHLVEKYFHPDNMSSEEKMKLELQKVRDEFKMSESDCGSFRVQVAQLTTKIKHLSTVLHKKDKHSRKGLQAMVQKRKKLLKYLRRTDWDSYCLVLSKLGLRDNPDYKF